MQGSSEQVQGSAACTLVYCRHGSSCTISDLAPHSPCTKCTILAYTMLYHSPCTTLTAPHSPFNTFALHPIRPASQSLYRTHLPILTLHHTHCTTLALTAFALHHAALHSHTPHPVRYPTPHPCQRVAIELPSRCTLSRAQQSHIAIQSNIMR